MKKEDIKLILVMVLFVLLLYQLSINASYKYKKEEMSQYNNSIEVVEESVEDINIMEILDTINNSQVNINTFKKENNKWRGSITVKGEQQELEECMNILKELEVKIENYSIEKNENVMVYLEVILP